MLCYDWHAYMPMAPVVSKKSKGKTMDVRYVSAGASRDVQRFARGKSKIMMY